MIDRLAVLEGAYLRDLLSQPAALRSAHGRLKQNGKSPILRAALLGNRQKRVILTGMGSSLYALYPLYLRLNRCGLQAQLFETSELIQYLPELVDPDSLFIAVSQSGRSAETLGLLDLAEGKTTLIGVTNNETSPLAQRSTAAVLIHAGEESSVSCKTYVTSLLTLAWLGALLTGDDDESTLRTLEAAERGASDYLGFWRDHVLSLANLLEGISQLFLTGRGPSLAAAQTGGLIIKESTRFAAEGMSSASFRHGPFEVLGPGVLVAILGGAERTLALNRRLAIDVREAGGIAALIHAESERAEFRLPQVAEEVLPIMEILPMQMISLALATIRGREPGIFRLATKITEVE